jgi:AcrR family transcriptional regulator
MAPPDSAPQQTEPLFPALDGGLRGLPPERVAEHQEVRLQMAMVEAVTRFGYAGTTLRELVRLAGVSKSTFYEHYESKEDCFLATFETVVAQVSERVGRAYREAGDRRQRLVAALTAFMNLVVEEPAASTLATVESLTLGAAGIAPRERASEVFEQLLRQSFEHSPSGRPVSPATVRAISAGIRGVVYRHLRDGTPEQLPALVEELVDWALGYQRSESETVRRAAAAAATPADAVAGNDEELAWTEPPDSPRSRAELTQKERIVRAVARLVVERGYETLSIPAISATAGTSNQTFYEHFGNKRDAILAAFDVIAAEGLAVTTQAFEAGGDGPEAVGVALRAILEEIAGNELFARLTFFELQTAGPVALDRADAVMDSFTAFLRPDVAPGAINAPPTPTVRHAVGSGVWAVIQHELGAGDTASLLGLGPQLAQILLTPSVES